MKEPKINLSGKNEKFASGIVKPKGKFWKRFFNKKVRNGATHKKSNWFEWGD